MSDDLGIDLANTSVFLDFDGTISTQDTGVYLLERFATPIWLDYHEQYERGEINSRAVLVGQWGATTADEVTMRAAARDVTLDVGFEPLVAALQAGGAELTVVSDGFGFYAHDVCDPLGIPVITNEINWATGEIEFPFGDPTCACQACGVCKPAPIKEASARGRTTVLIGDGASDRMAAAVADVVFAKDGLAEFCRQSGHPFIAFAGLDEVRAYLVGER
jgi:2-hydroxy-3-keto-5-methylthiopentenyl-1-phosphate phosphatase